MRQVLPRCGGLIMHSDHISVMLIRPGGGRPVPLALDYRWISRFDSPQNSTVDHQQVRHSLSMAKTNKGYRVATKIENPATHCLNRCDPCGILANGSLRSTI